mmetsp:Transcript_20485/g.46499  ORF Transcript_20485/g.46499 Transcript_20485/m.46499 type:complete len:144 (+) Transcript_20485:69-500(+)
MSDDEYEYVSYKSSKTIVAETVYHFFRGGLYGAAFGLVTPFYEAGTKGAIEEAKTGIFKPAPVFGSLSSVPSNAFIFGSLLAIQRFTCKSAELLRGKQDPWNDAAGCLVAYPYYQTCLTKHALLHNRVVGGLLLASIAFANIP